MRQFYQNSVAVKQTGNPAIRDNFKVFLAFAVWNFQILHVLSYFTESIFWLVSVLVSGLDYFTNGNIRKCAINEVKNCFV